MKYNSAFYRTMGELEYQKELVDKDGNLSKNEKELKKLKLEKELLRLRSIRLEENIKHNDFKGDFARARRILIESNTEVDQAIEKIMSSNNSNILTGGK